MLTLLIWSVAGMNAQVNIGSEDLPHTGAVLDLSRAADLGLLLPYVDYADSDLFPADLKEDGMVVYNLADKKIYYYKGTAADGTWVSSDTADKAVRLATAQDFSLTGDVTATAIPFDGTGAVTLSTELETITQNNPAPTAVAPGAGGEFTVIDGITVDSKGRITGYSTKTVTLPAAPVYTPGNVEWHPTDFSTDMSWADAADAGTGCASLTENGGGWRMPTVDELVRAYHSGSPGGFAAFQNYWSGTESDADKAYIVFMSNGDVTSVPKEYTYYVRCVR